jgi:hypothetical protein
MPLLAPVLSSQAALPGFTQMPGGSASQAAGSGGGLLHLIGGSQLLPFTQPVQELEQELAAAVAAAADGGDMLDLAGLDQLLGLAPGALASQLHASQQQQRQQQGVGKAGAEAARADMAAAAAPDGEPAGSGTAVPESAGAEAAAAEQQDTAADAVVLADPAAAAVGPAPAADDEAGGRAVDPMAALGVVLQAAVDADPQGVANLADQVVL